MHRDPGFTLVELLVIIAIIAILLSIVTPALTTALLRVDMTTCQSNLHQLGVAHLSYVADNKHRFVPFRKWVAGNYTDKAALCDPTRSLIYPYIGIPEFFLCPTFTQVCASNAVRSYVMQHSFGDTEGWYNANNWGNGYSIDTPAQVKEASRLGLVTEEATYKVQANGVWYSQYQVNDAHLVCPDWPARDTIAQFHYPGPGDVDKQIIGVGNVTFVDGHVDDVVTTQTPYVVSQKWY